MRAILKQPVFGTALRGCVGDFKMFNSVHEDDAVFVCFEIQREIKEGLKSLNVTHLRLAPEYLSQVGYLD